MRMLVYDFRKIMRHHYWIQRPGIILALLVIVLAFLTLGQQRSGLKMLCSTAQTHITTYTEFVYSGYAAVVHSNEHAVMHNRVLIFLLLS